MNVKLTKKRIDELAAESESVNEFILSLFQEVYGEDTWNQIVSVETDQYPVCGKQTWKYICQICIEKSEGRPPAGGLYWMNQGFTVEEGHSEWTVWLQDVELEDGSMFPSGKSAL